MEQLKKSILFGLLTGFVLLNSACPGGFLGDHATGGPVVSSSEVAIGGTWQLKSVSCNYSNPSHLWQQQGGAGQTTWQIANRLTQEISTDANGCTKRTEQSLHQETTNLGSDFTVTTLRQACDTQCASDCNAVGESYMLNISAFNNELSIIDSTGNTLCEKAGQNGPMTMTFVRAAN